MEFMSKQWREMVAFAIEEAARVGLEVSVNLSSCAGALKRPWPVGKDAPKRMIWNGVPLVSETRHEMKLKPPSDREFFTDIATFAVKYDGDVIKPIDQWLNAGDGPLDGWSGKKLGESTQRKASSAESVGRFWFRKFAELVKQGDLNVFERLKAIGFSHGQFRFVVETLHDT